MAIEIIGAACSLGGKHPGCRNAPTALRDHFFSSLRACISQPIAWKTTVVEGTAPPGYAIEDFCRRLRAVVSETLQICNVPIVLGGDHSCAIGTWSAVANQQGAIGMLWVDAHLDSHTPKTTLSGAIHGMPVACLLGTGPDGLVQLCPTGQAILPRHTCLIGARNIEPGEREFLMDLDVTVFTMDDIRQRGLSHVLREAYARVSACPSGFGISIDLDVVDPMDAPGVSIPEPGGIRADELIAAIRALSRGPAPSAFEIAEYNPDFDEDGRTSSLVGRLIEAGVSLIR